MSDLFDPFVDGKRCADGEQHQCDNERPEVSLPSVAKWVDLGRGPARASATQK